jgi:hypothetical protein
LSLQDTVVVSLFLYRSTTSFVSISLYNAEGQKISTSVHGKEGVFLAKIREILKNTGKINK